MAITLVQKKKIQQSLVLVLVAVLLVTSTVIWFGFFSKSGVEPVLEPVSPALQQVEIDFGVLELPLLKDVDNPPEGVEEPEAPGRKNPFLPF